MAMPFGSYNNNFITMEETITTASPDKICPICGVVHKKLVHHFVPSLESDVIASVQKDFPNWQTTEGICSRCYDEFEGITHYQYQCHEKPLDDFKLKFLDFYILPIGTRLNADTDFTGKDVTICFIDSGFYMHPDIKDRIKKVVDITDDTHDESYFKTPHDNAWHGTMTSTVCAGNGSLSNGLYKGLASEANLVLLKVQNEDGKIKDEAIVKALQWVHANHKKYDIRIVNISLSGDISKTIKESEINQLADALFSENVLVVSAVGNSTDASVLPPASSPHVVAVGGLDDQNKLDGDIILYHSTYGVTVDGYAKPELITNSIWLPAPILPGSGTQEKAAVLFKAVEHEDYMPAIIENNKQLLAHEFDLYAGKEKIWKEVKHVIWKEKFITPHYMHVDGTSFAAPLVCSVAAQMLEANPALSAQEMRNILLSTSKMLLNYDISRQGFGRMQPKQAVFAALAPQEEVVLKENPQIDYEKKRMTFTIYAPNAKKSLSLSGSFCNWKIDTMPMRPAKNGYWYIHMPILKPGEYEYKFIMDGTFWQEDVDNPWRRNDEHCGWNSVFQIN